MSMRSVSNRQCEFVLAFNRVICCVENEVIQQHSAFSAMLTAVIRFLQIVHLREHRPPPTSAIFSSVSICFELSNELAKWSWWKIWGKLIHHTHTHRHHRKPWVSNVDTWILLSASISSTWLHQNTLYIYIQRNAIFVGDGVVSRAVGGLSVDWMMRVTLAQQFQFYDSNFSPFIAAPVATPFARA